MGPLSGFRVLELQGLGPAPFAGMLLADLGAEVISITRRSARDGEVPDNEVSERGKKSIALNLKHPDGIAVLLDLVKASDALIEGFRPGVMERMGVGPETCFTINEKLVYGRMTGWGQTGPLAPYAGHDINYIALSGALHASGRSGEKPTPAINLVGDFGGGGAFLVIGVLSALLEASRSGKGQVVDASMVEGSAALMHLMYSFLNNNTWNWQDERGVNALDTGAHFYDTYETADGKYLAVGSLEPQFYSEMLEKLGLDTQRYTPQFNAENWPSWKAEIASAIAGKTRDEWCEIFEYSDACVAPVLSMREAPEHPHNRSRKSFVDVAGHLQPAPAPRFSRTENADPAPPPRPGQDGESVLREICGYYDEAMARVKREKVLL